eukprot:2034616-Rhodomonas_salina.1
MWRGGARRPGWRAPTRREALHPPPALALPNGPSQPRSEPQRKNDAWMQLAIFFFCEKGPSLKKVLVSMVMACSAALHALAGGGCGGL